MPRKKSSNVTAVTASSPRQTTKALTQTPATTTQSTTQRQPGYHWNLSAVDQRGDPKDPDIMPRYDGRPLEPSQHLRVRPYSAYEAGLSGPWEPSETFSSSEYEEYEQALPEHLVKLTDEKPPWTADDVPSARTLSEATAPSTIPEASNAAQREAPAHHAEEFIQPYGLPPPSTQASGFHPRRPTTSAAEEGLSVISAAEKVEKWGRTRGRK